MSQIPISDKAPSVAETVSVRIGERISVALGLHPEVSPYVVMLAPVPGLPEPAALGTASLCVIAAQRVDGVSDRQLWRCVMTDPIRDLIEVRR